MLATSTTNPWAGAEKRAADALRFIARDEGLKSRLMTDPALRAIAERVAANFVAGESIDTAVARAKAVNAAGHAATIDYMGESCRDEALANAETEQFLTLMQRLQSAPRVNASISLDISHIGSAISFELGLKNLRRIAAAARDAGQEVMVSMEGSERTDATLALYLAMHGEGDARFDNVGITLQARLLRTDDDMERLMQVPGRIRLVKGAYHEPAHVAHAYEAPETTQRYLHFAQRLLSRGHKCSIATSDVAIQDALHGHIQSNGWAKQPFEFEILMGLGTERLDPLRQLGYGTREYIVFGQEWFLYVCNRIADRPQRLLTAVADAIAAPSSTT
jgi:proline dehydrogenase